MARKKQEVQLQSMIETQEEWEEMLSKEGLTGIWFYRLIRISMFNVTINMPCRNKNGNVGRKPNA